MNTIERRVFPLKTLPNGDSHNITAFFVTGHSDGPCAYIQSGIHGGELQGTLVIYEILDYLKNHPLKGTVILVPMANPMGLDSKVGNYTYGRFNSVTGENWNRSYIDLVSHTTNFNVQEFAKTHRDDPPEKMKKAFKEEMASCLRRLSKHKQKHHYASSENERLAMTLQQLALPADIVLDIHTGSCACRYLYCPESRKEEGKILNFPFTLLIPPLFSGAIDEAMFVPWHTLERECKKLGREGDVSFSSYTLELGSEECVDREEAQQDAANILHCLCHRGMLEKAPERTLEKVQAFSLLKDFQTYYSPEGGLVEYLKAPGERFVAGEELAHLYRPPQGKQFDSIDSCIHTIKARDDGIVINHFPSANVGQGAALFQVMTQVMPSS